MRMIKAIKSIDPKSVTLIRNGVYLKIITLLKNDIISEVDNTLYIIIIVSSCDPQELSSGENPAPPRYLCGSFVGFFICTYFVDVICISK